MDDDRCCFTVEWYEELAARIRQFQLFFFVNSKAVEMFDLRNRKLFLRTSLKESNISLADFYVGNSLNICGRMLNIVDYGDEYTRRKLSGQKERTLGLVKPDAVDKLGEVLDIVYQKGFLISQLRMCRIEHMHVGAMYEEYINKPFYHTLTNYMTSGPLVVFEIVGERAISAWKDSVGPTDPSEARSSAATSIRARFGKDVIHNAVHASDSPAAAAREIELFFPSSGRAPPNSAKVGNCTCCLIKPTAVKAGLAGKIISTIIDAGFQVGAAQMFTLEKANAEEFLEVYKGVVNEYAAMVTELTSGPCLALEITGPDNTQPVAPAFRELVGPADPEIARTLRPRTLRAKFGIDKVKNAVHCTDLPDDGQLEVEYFFRILDR